MSTDAEFLERFESCAISRAEWNHESTVRMAFLYLLELPYEDALRRVRAGVRALHRANRVPETPTSGYHETETLAWTRLVASALCDPRASDRFEDFARSNRYLLTPGLLRLYYTKERLASPRARAGFVEPDLVALPLPCTSSVASCAA